MTISLLILIIAIVCLFLAALNVNTGPISIGWMGLAMWCLSTVIRG